MTVQPWQIDLLDKISEFTAGELVVIAATWTLQQHFDYFQHLVL